MDDDGPISPFATWSLPVLAQRLDDLKAERERLDAEIAEVRQEIDARRRASAKRPGDSVHGRNGG